MRLHTEHNKLHSNLKLASSPTCLCGQEGQTTEHVLQRCPLHKATEKMCGLSALPWRPNSTAASRSWRKRLHLSPERPLSCNLRTQDTTENIQINETEIEKVTNYKFLGQKIAMENRAKQEVSIKIKAGWSVSGKYREIFQDKHLPMSLKRKVFNQCVLPAMTYGCQTWSLAKALVKKRETSQRAMERRMLNATLKDRIRNTNIRQRTRGN